MTSNLGADVLGAAAFDDGVVGAGVKEGVFEAVRRHFAPEFINRIDEMVSSKFGLGIEKMERE